MIWLLEVKDPAGVFVVPEIRRHLDRFYVTCGRDKGYASVMARDTGLADTFSSSSGSPAIRSASAAISSEPTSVGPSAHIPARRASCGRSSVSKTSRSAASWAS